MTANSKEIMELLQAPFPPQDIEWRVGSTSKDKSKGMALAYVTNRAIQNRLDEVFGPFGWKNEFKEWKGHSQLCGISVKVDGEWITKWDGADDSNMEATKGGLSDAMKRAAYQWGIGRYLYKLDAIWVPLKDGKYLQHEPHLPEWALPKGYKPEKKQQPEKPKQAPQSPQKPVGNPAEEDKQHILNVLDLWSKAGQGDATKFNSWLQKNYKKTTEELSAEEIQKIESWLAGKIAETSQKGA